MNHKIVVQLNSEKYRKNWELLTRRNKTDNSNFTIWINVTQIINFSQKDNKQAKKRLKTDFMVSKNNAMDKMNLF